MVENPEKESKPSLEALDLDGLAAATVADRGEVWLLQWLHKLQNDLDASDEDTLRASQSQIESDLVRLLTQIAPTSRPAPAPGRPIRNMIARILVKLFDRAEQRTLFDVVGNLLRVAGTEPSKVTLDNRSYRVSCFYVAGEIMKVHGSQVMSQFAESVLTSLKVIKANTSPPLLRYQALHCLNSALIIGSKTLTASDNLAKDVLKTLRATLADKTYSIIRGTVECLLSLSDRSSNLLSSMSDIESLDTVDFVTRRSLSRLIANLLASTQIAGSAANANNQLSASAKSKKKKDGSEMEEDDPYPNSMTAEEKGKTLLKPEEMLALLSTPYSRPSTTRRTRLGLIDAYGALLTLLGSTWVEQQYPEILQHIINVIGCWKPSQSSSLTPAVLRHETLISRKMASILLRDIISVRLLSEQGQVVAIREISSSILNKWPALMPTQQPPSKYSLVIALNEVENLLKQVGSATLPIQEVLYNPLIRLLGHSSYSVQIAAALCLRTYCYVAPIKLTNTITHTLELLNKDLAQLSNPAAPPDTNKRAIGHAHGLAGLMSVISLRPLYVSFDVSSKVMSVAIQLLKQSGSHSLKISAFEIQVTWILVSALTSLGPNFVKLHLSQLLLLWKNALPKPMAKDATNNQFRSDGDWGFLLHIRECTLGAILNFLKHDGDKLVTLDVARRIVVMLNNALAFLGDFEKKYLQAEHEQAPFASSKMNLIDRHFLMRRRVFQCFTALSKISMTSVEAHQINLLDMTLSLMADPEKYTGSSSQAAISASTKITGLLKENESIEQSNEGSASVGRDRGLVSDWLNRDLTDVAIESVLHQSSIESNEHDFLVLCTPKTLDGPIGMMGHETVLPAPPIPTSMIDSAIELFALYLPLVNTKQQVAILERLYSHVTSMKTEKNPGRKMAILANSITAFLLSTRTCMSSGYTGRSKTIDTSVASLMKDILKEGLVHMDSRIRAASAEAFGRVCALAGNTFMVNQIQHCVTQIVNNTDPHSRSGYALSFSQIYTQVGSLSAGAVLKTVVDILMSLSADPHPLVHFWALKALSEVIHTAGLSYSPFLNSTLDVVVKLYCTDSHEVESGSTGYVNIRGNLPTYQNFCKILNAVIGVLGPELSSCGQAKILLQLLNEELNEEADDGIKVEALKSIQHFVMFSIESINLTQLIQTLRKHLSSNRRTLKVASINSIYQLVQKNAALMSKIGGDRLVVNLFSILDEDPTIEGVRDSIKSWLRQTADSNPTAWIDLCMRIVSRSTTAQVKAVEEEGAGGGFIDEESQGLDLKDNGGPNANKSHTNSRWRTQLFALQCLHEVFLTLIRSKKNEHFSAQIAKSKGFGNFRPLMISRVSDLIKMAFTASTASIMEIRLEGLNVLRDVIENFKYSSDLDFDEAPLLEQHQAPIAAALTPAFSHDSFPEVLASAIQVCAVFVGSGVVKEIDKMGRMLKLLTSALESCRDTEIISLGEMKELSSTASVMIKTAVYAAWAEFQVTSVKQNYLCDVIKPHLALLCPLWVASLREYARLKSDEEASSTGSSHSNPFDTMQRGFTREIWLPYYESAWLKMMRATAYLIKAKEPFILRALDGADIPNTEKVITEPTTNSVEPRDEPAMYFHVLLGLVYEAAALTASAGTDDPASSAAQVMETSLVALEALLQKEVAGIHGLKKDSAVFSEICNLCYRLAATETARTQVLVVRCILQLGLGCLGPSQKANEPDTALQVNQCLRVIIQLLRNAIPSMSSMAASKARKAPAHYAALVISAFSACADLADRNRVYGVALGLFSEILKDRTAGIDLVGPALPALKTLVERGFALKPEGQESEILSSVLHGLLSQALQTVEDTRQEATSNTSSRNNLLACVLIFTSLPSGVKVSRTALEHCCSLITTNIMSDQQETATTALHCAKSLILTKNRVSGVLQVSLTQLLPALIDFLAKLAGRSEFEPVHLGMVSEVLKTFSGILSFVQVEQRPQTMSIFLPVYLMLLSESSLGIRPIAIQHILSLASLDAAAFKEATNALEADQRSCLENALRGSIQSTLKSTSSNPASVSPSIALKSFG
ncbi:armadillo-type protein [Melampsora americana]|nr:armadillo-type protein [Melampsora americana]